MSAWRFAIAGGPMWADGVNAAPTEEGKRAFWEVTVRHFAVHQGPAPPQPCVVVCHVSAPAAWGLPGGPLGRAKSLLDALHDDRGSGPKYRELVARPPLRDDHPNHVSGLAVEVVTGPPRTDYLLGTKLIVSGELLASILIPTPAPNDIVGTRGEKHKIAEARLEYGLAVRRAFKAHLGLMGRRPQALVVRHLPQRDEDNTWQTWLHAVCGSRRYGTEHWAAGAPLGGWTPTSVASLADLSLDVPVAYDVWG